MDVRMQSLSKITSASSSRILYDIPCKVCRDHSSGKHYGIFACDGCAGFFKRSVRRNRQYVCKSKVEGSCIVDKTHRNQCRACRLAKCQEAGMNKDAVQHERGPRNSTLRRQMSIYVKDSSDRLLVSSPGSVLDLAVPKDLSSAHLEHGFAPQHFSCSPRSPKLGMPLLPIFAPTMISTETICESAARLLFMNVKWTKNVPSFTTLPFPDQLLLLEETWRELFVLGAAQFLVPLELSPLLHAYSRQQYPEQTLGFLHEVKQFQETIAKFSHLHVDSNEFSCLRAVVLFKTAFDGGSTSSASEKTLTDIARVVALQDQSQLMLNNYIRNAYPTQPLRFGKLLLLLPTLRTVTNNTIEELFFRKTIGNIPIERIICDMYKTNDV